MPYPRFTKIIINYFLSQNKSLAKKKHSYINIIKDDDDLNRLKFVKIAVTPKKKGSITAADNKHASEEEFDESDGEHTNRPTGSRRPSGVVFRDTFHVSKKKLLDQSQKLKGIQMQTEEEQLAADTMQAIKASRKVSKSQPHTKDSSEGDGIKPEVSDESTCIFTTSSEGTGITLGVPDEVKGSSATKADSAIDWGSENESDQFDETQVNEVEIEWVSTNKQEEQQDDQDDDDDDRSIDLEETNDDEKTDDECMHDDEYVHNNPDEEMKDAEDAEAQKDDDEITDATNADAEKTEEVKGDNKQTRTNMAKVDQAKDTSAQDNQTTAHVFVKLKEMPKLPPTSSSLSVSSIFSNQFLNLSSDISLVGTIQSPTLLIVPVSVIPEQPVTTPSPSLTTETPVSTVLSHHPSVTTITLVQQQTTPIPTPPINIVASTTKRGDANPDKVLRKRDHGDDEDEDPFAGPN
ncbi:hypothetical protein Tco_0352994 [Tanacetum coccineum]